MDCTRIPIFFTFDDNFAYTAAVAFYSLLKRAKLGVCYDMFVLHHDISKDHQSMLTGIVDGCGNGKLTFVNTEGFLAKEWAAGKWDEEKNGHRFTVDTIVICFAARLFPQYEKIICSDVDVVFQDDISELWEMDLEDKYLAAVRCVLLKHRPSDRDNLSPVYREKLASTYFVTGIVVFNLKKIREDGIENRMMEVILDPNMEKRWPDQDILNIACDNNVKYLPLNYFAYPQLAKALQDSSFTSYYSREEMYDSIIRPKIIHYAGFKPWNTHTEWEKAWWDVADFLRLPVRRPSSALPCGDAQSELLALKRAKRRYRALFVGTLVVLVIVVMVFCVSVIP